VLGAIAPDVVAVHFSGVREPADVAAIASGRPDAALIGETLMRDDDPRERLQRLVAAAAGRPSAAPDPENFTRPRVAS
jgi:indole-3-glycerol phosphate synthase